MAAQIKWSRREGILIAAPIGRIDGNNYIEVQNALESGIDPDEHAMILDFAQLGYISSAGLRVCLIIAKKFNPEGKAFGICNLSESIRDCHRERLSRDHVDLRFAKRGHRSHHREGRRRRE